VDSSTYHLLEVSKKRSLAIKTLYPFSTCNLAARDEAIGPPADYASPSFYDYQQDGGQAKKRSPAISWYHGDMINAEIEKMIIHPKKQRPDHGSRENEYPGATLLCSHKHPRNNRGRYDHRYDEGILKP
jgi:hypothetical protein